MPQLNTQQRVHCQAVVTALQNHQAQITPLISAPYLGTTPHWFDFSARNPGVAALDMTQPQHLQNYIQTELQNHSCRFGIGRYNEDRVCYRQSNLFQDSQSEPRSIHLAYDIWLPVGTPLYVPLPAIIHSVKNNNKFLDYGATIILEHILDNVRFYSLYGHLSLTSLTGKQPGQSLRAGELFAWIGDMTENGQWAPHVHAQIICDLLGQFGDFPGVARPSERNYYTTLCPDPSLLFKF